MFSYNMSNKNIDDKLYHCFLFLKKWHQLISCSNFFFWVIFLLQEQHVGVARAVGIVNSPSFLISCYNNVLFLFLFWCFFINGATIAMLMTSIIIFGFYVIVFLEHQKLQQHCNIIFVFPFFLFVVFLLLVFYNKIFMFCRIHLVSLCIQTNFVAITCIER